MPVSLRSSARVPKYCRFKRKGRRDSACVLIDGKRIMLGVYGSHQSREKYAELIAGSGAPGDPLVAPPSTDPTVVELIAAYMDHCETYYRKPNGAPGNEYENVRAVCKVLRREVGRMRASEFGPMKLIGVRDAMIGLGWSRRSINSQVGRVRRIFKWCASQEKIPASIAQALMMVDGLRRGRSKARETSPVRPVDDATINATIEHLPTVVADMVRVQRLTGCRPGELIAMRPGDIDRSGKVWLYRPDDHKTAHLDHTRTIAIGPKAQDILLRYLARGDEMFCFRPRDSEQKRRSAQHAERQTPMSCGNRPGTNRAESPKTTAGDAYTTDSYRRAIVRAAKRASVEPWTPHRLRHTAATEVRKAFGLDAAQSVLGHRHAAITEVYAELHVERAAEVAAKIG